MTTPLLLRSGLRMMSGCLAMALMACTAGPDYQRPSSLHVEHFAPASAEQSLRASGLVATGEPIEPWWKIYKSARLDRLVERALARNPTVRMAQASLHAAEEARLAQQAQFYPTASVALGASRQRVATPLASPLASASDLFNLATAQVSVSYNLDLFGGNRRMVESMDASVQEQRWNLEATYLTLGTNVVVAAVSEAGFAAQAGAVRRQIELQTQILQGYRRMRDSGQAGDLDVLQQEAQLSALNAALPGLQRQVALQHDLLRALAGDPPDDDAQSPLDLDELTLSEPIPLTLPSALTGHRPDILAAEAQLRSASAQIGVAASNRLPQLTLGVDTWGKAATSLATLFSPGSTFWNLAGSVTQPVFDGGELRHREAAARAVYDEAVANYQATVVNAFQNVADTLQALEADARAERATRSGLQSAERSLATTRRQLELGDVPSMAVMLSEQLVQQNAATLASARAATLCDAAALLQALGGGWWKRSAADPVVSPGS